MECLRGRPFVIIVGPFNLEGDAIQQEAIQIHAGRREGDVLEFDKGKARPPRVGRA